MSTKLNICGTANIKRGVLRPYLAANDTKTKFPISEPMHSNDVTNDASITVNLPLGKGVSSEIHSMKLTVENEHVVPYENVIKLPKKSSFVSFYFLT